MGGLNRPPILLRRYAMPNWCFNRVTVWSDNTSDMQEFKELVKGRGENTQAFSFDSILPMPEELRSVQSPVSIRTKEEIEEYKQKHSDNRVMLETLPITQEDSDRFDAKYGDNNWYDWCCNNWGVKWDCSDVDISEEYADLELRYTFDTPWGPPEEIHTYLKARFPEIHIQWFWDEPGMEEAGYLK